MKSILILFAIAGAAVCTNQSRQATCDYPPEYSEVCKEPGRNNIDPSKPQITADMFFTTMYKISPQAREKLFIGLFKLLGVEPDLDRKEKVQLLKNQLRQASVLKKCLDYCNFFFQGEFKAERSRWDRGIKIDNRHFILAPCSRTPKINNWPRIPPPCSRTPKINNWPRIPPPCSSTPKICEKRVSEIEESLKNLETDTKTALAEIFKSLQDFQAQHARTDGNMQQLETRVQEGLNKLTQAFSKQEKRLAETENTTKELENQMAMKKSSKKNSTKCFGKG